MPIGSTVMGSEKGRVARPIVKAKAKAKAKTKAGRMPNVVGYGIAVTPTETGTAAGYMVVLEQEPDDNGASRELFVGWAPIGGIEALRRRVQLGSPREIVIRAFFRSTRSAVDHIRARFVNYKCRTDDTNWFRRAPMLEYFLEDLRAVYDASQKKAPAPRNVKSKKKASNRRRN